MIYLRNPSIHYKPSAADLARATRLERWSLVDERVGDGAVLVGRRADRAEVETAPVVAIDPTAGWARTHSALWRLGRREHPDRLMHPSLRAYLPDAGNRAREIGYEDPPSELDRGLHLQEPGAFSQWSALMDWLVEAHGPFADQALLIYISRRQGVTLGEACGLSDEFKKNWSGNFGHN